MNYNRLASILVIILFIVSCQRTAEVKDQLVKEYVYATKIPPIDIKNQDYDSIIILSSTQLAYFTALDALDKIIGVSSFDHIYSDSIIDVLRANGVKELGGESSLNIEEVLRLRPDLILFSSPLADNQFPILQKSNIHCVSILDYQEGHPLGRMEWIKVVGDLIGKSDDANNYFDRIAQQYLTQKENTTSTTKTVLVGSAFQGEWYVPADSSFVAILIRDAGGVYEWQYSKSKQHTPRPHSIEKIYKEAKEADVWINVGSYNTLEKLNRSEPRYVLFDAFKNQEIYNFSNRISSNGSFDFYQSGVVRPDLILRDLSQILHNDLDSLYFYEKLR